MWGDIAICGMITNERKIKYIPKVNYGTVRLFAVSICRVITILIGVMA